MDFKGTKGKWRVIEEDDYHAVVLIESGWQFGRTYIAQEIRQGYDEGKADATLIAHAPELLDKLNSILNMSENQPRAGCTYGDTELSSIDVCFGYNLALEHVKDGLEELIKRATEV